MYKKKRKKNRFKGSKDNKEEGIRVCNALKKPKLKEYAKSKIKYNLEDDIYSILDCSRMATIIAQDGS